MKALKFLAEGGRGPYSDFSWPLPKDGKPGKWVKATGKLIACQNGIHACTMEQAPAWLQAECYVIELAGEIEDSGDKLVARKGRLLYRVETWNEKNARLFAADCAEHLLPLFEAKHSNDERPRAAIEAARAYARGEATATELAAAGDAAGDAARAAAGAAAGDAEIRSQSRRLVHYLKVDL